jgi:hypothetical protein
LAELSSVKGWAFFFHSSSWCPSSPLIASERVRAHLRLYGDRNDRGIALNEAEIRAFLGTDYPRLVNGLATSPLNSAESPFHAVACLGDQHNPRVVAGTAVLAHPAKELYDVHYTSFRPDGPHLEVLRTEDHHHVGWGERLPLQEPSLCGAPVGLRELRSSY